MDLKTLNEWLKPLDQAPLECDGMSRAVSTLLRRENIPHRILAGQLAVETVGDIPLHFWVEFPDGAVCDFRARMWLGVEGDIPHGVFYPAIAQQYHATGSLEEDGLSPMMFEILTGLSLSAYAAPGTSTHVDSAPPGP